MSIKFICDKCKTESTILQHTFLPKDWKYLGVNGELCPKCAEQYNKLLEERDAIIEKFIKEIK